MALPPTNFREFHKFTHEFVFQSMLSEFVFQSMLSVITGGLDVLPKFKIQAHSATVYNLSYVEIKLICEWCVYCLQHRTVRLGALFFGRHGCVQFTDLDFTLPIVLLNLVAN